MARQFKKPTKIQKIVKVVKKPVVQTHNRVGNQVAHGQVTSGQAAPTTPSFEMPKGKYFQAVGRRKVATARVRIFEKAGDFIVNGMAAGQYFSNVPNASVLYQRPLVLTGLQGKLTIVAKVAGSGTRAQLSAVVHGLSRAIVAYNVDLKPLLKAEKLLTRDDRMKETRKIGMGGKARRQRQSPKR